MLYRLVCAVTYLFSRIAFRMRYEGLENIPQEGGFILSSNHQSNFDPVFLAHKVKQPLRFLGKEELFKNKFFAWVLTQLGAFPIARGTGDMDALATATEIVRQGSALVIFPEGTRSKSGKPLRARSGVAYVAGRANVGILPCSIDYKGKLAFRREITLRFHPILPVEELQIDVENPRTLRTASRKVMDVICSGLTWKGPYALQEGTE